jgi:glucose/arabinose dehydrogenase
VAEEEPPRATIRVFAADGSGGRTFASGLRNPVGIAIRPGSDELWAVVNERDGLGDGLVPDYLARVREGAFHGWPYAYAGPNPDPDFGAKRPDLVAATVVPDVLFESHSAPLGLVFYEGAQFPDEYRGDAFVALHGSWNRSRPTGYKVVRVPFEDGRPVGGYENFAVGFWIEGEETARVWGRPAGLALGGDGSLLVADDAGGTVWRIRWVGP